MGRFVRVLAGLMKLDIGDRPSSAANGFAIHAANKADERCGARKEPQDVIAMVVELRSIDVDKADIVGSGVETDAAQPRRIKLSRGFSSRSAGSLSKPFDRWVIRNHAYSSLIGCNYNLIEQKIFAAA
jgi:hypothetical protein